MIVSVLRIFAATRHSYLKKIHLLSLSKNILMLQKVFFNSSVVDPGSFL
jgi:hypothetical protein